MAGIGLFLVSLMVNWYKLSIKEAITKLVQDAGLELLPFTQEEEPVVNHDFEIKTELKELGFVHKNITNMSNNMSNMRSTNKQAPIQTCMNHLTKPESLKTLKILIKDLKFPPCIISSMLSSRANKITELTSCLDNIKLLRESGHEPKQISGAVISGNREKGEAKLSIKGVITKLVQDAGLELLPFTQEEESEAASSSKVKIKAKRGSKPKTKVETQTKTTKTKDDVAKKDKAVAKQKASLEDEDSEETEDEDYQASSSAAVPYSDSDSDTDLARQHDMESSSAEDSQENDPMFFASATPILSAASQTPVHPSSSSSSSYLWMASTPLPSTNQTPVHLYNVSADEMGDNADNNDDNYDGIGHELAFASFESDMLG